jgi:hypothetical protein
MSRRDRRFNVGWLFLAMLGPAALAADAPAEAQLAISANDNKLALVKGVTQVMQPARHRRYRPERKSPKVVAESRPHGRRPPPQPAITPDRVARPGHL